MSYGSSKIALSNLPFRVADFFRGYWFVYGSRTPMFVQSYSSVQTLSTSTVFFFLGHIFYYTFDSSINWI